MVVWAMKALAWDLGWGMVAMEWAMDMEWALDPEWAVAMAWEVDTEWEVDMVWAWAPVWAWAMVAWAWTNLTICNGPRGADVTASTRRGTLMMTDFTALLALSTASQCA